MKICLINNLYKPYSRGGAEKVVELVAEELVKKGHEVFIIATKPLFGQKSKKIKKQENKIYFIPAIYYNLDKLPVVVRLFWHLIDMFDIGSYFAVKRILKKERPDIVMTHNLKGIGYLIPSAIRKFKIRHIHTLHDIQLIHPSGLMMYGQEKKVNSVFAKIYAAICRWLISSPDVVVSPSKWLLGEHERRGFFKKSKKVVLQNPIDVVAQETGNRKQETGIFKFLCVSQIEEHKGILFLIEAFKKINTPFNKGPACRTGRGAGGFLRSELLIVGDGSKMKVAEELASGIENIKFLGKKNKDEVAFLMRETDCLIVPSLCYENSPTVIYEAFAVGLPAIAPNLGGVPELLENGAGILFRPGDGNDLAEKMKWAIKNKNKLQEAEEKMTEKTREYSIDNYINKLISL